MTKKARQISLKTYNGRRSRLWQSPPTSRAQIGAVRQLALNPGAGPAPIHLLRIWSISATLLVCWMDSNIIACNAMYCCGNLDMLTQVPMKFLGSTGGSKQLWSFSYKALSFCSSEIFGLTDMVVRYSLTFPVFWFPTYQLQIIINKLFIPIPNHGSTFISRCVQPPNVFAQTASLTSSRQAAYLRREGCIKRIQSYFKL